VEDMIRRFHSALPQIRAWIDRYLESNAANARRLDSMPPLRTAFPPEVFARARMVLVSQTPFPPVSRFGLPEFADHERRGFDGISYTYNADDNVKSFAVSAPSTQTTSYAYDTANRLISGLFSGSTPQYNYSYDAASNLTSITPDGTQQTFSYTSTNAITAGTYDANGSPTAIAGNVYTWDGANRIIAFSNSANQTSSSFTYDGLGRLVRVVDSNSGAVTADHSYTWCGAVRCLAHDNTQSGSPVSTQYFPQGVITNGTTFYYVQDQLGSVTQLVTNSGSIAAQYSYDPYGNQTTVSGSVVSDIGYAGYFSHAASGLDFTLYRAYDPSHARWLNRDPIGEAGGVNLYAYVDGNPISEIDPLGLWGIVGNAGGAGEVGGGGGVGGGVAAAANSGIGIFGGGPAGVNVGGYTASGVSPLDNPDQFILGATAGLGVGGFITNAKCAHDLLGPFTTWTLNLPIISLQYAYGGGIWTGGFSIGKSWGLDFSRYTVTTTTATSTSGCGCN
jgi:RHS repeat-associated protein